MAPSWTWASVGNAVQYEMDVPGNEHFISIEKTAQRDSQLLSVPWAKGESERFRGRTKGELVIKGHLAKTKMRRYHTTEGTKYGVTRYNRVDRYDLRLDSLPEDDSAWTACEPGWIDRPTSDPDRYVSYK